ncbi:MAG: hypothetical protein KAI17_20365 [Thiotrichaceae bacterium]|nr:hypothetical protein [Thiotrichaceae bacterium]
MNRNSIDIITTAKKQLKIRRTLNIVGICTIILSILSAFLFNIPEPYFTTILYALIAAVFLNNGDFKIFGFDMITRAELISIIEDNINNDAEAMLTISKH